MDEAIKAWEEFLTELFPDENDRTEIQKFLATAFVGIKGFIASGSIKELTIESSKVNEFRDLYLFLLALGESEEEAKKKILEIIDANYGVPVCPLAS